MRKTIFILLGLMLVLSLALVGCGPDRDADEPVPEEGEAGAHGEADQDMPEKPAKLSIWANDEEDQLAAITKIAEEYTDKTGIEVEVIPFSMLEQTENIALDGPAGRGPDLFFQPHDRLGDVVLQGLAQPLNVPEDVLNQYTPEALDAFSYEGELYALPMVIETYGLVYNTDLVPEAPETMQELLQIAEELTNAANDEYGFLMEANNFYFAYPFISGYGGYVFGFDDDGFNADDIGLANEGAIEGAELIKSWFDAGYIPQSITGDIMNGLFTDGKVGVVVTGPWSIAPYRQALGDKVATAPLPQLDNGDYPKSFIGVKGWLVSEYSEHPEWATDLAIFMTSYESAKTYYMMANEIPPRPDLIEDPLIADDPIVAGFAVQTTRGEPMPNIPEMSMVWGPMNDALNFIAQGEDPREVLEEAVELIKEQIAMQRGN
ncbi:maltose ABC transporter substrate-binding protein [Caldalkalibacillus thermarum]|uniref:extracellular solute-binding protein n=1 Tax=Caldalkalibacillus thermarum TaxID=296745 RepID=UPI00166E392E|nr:extracellular solute-binding protein [Caldalkalibacillus thermarum]GGK11798.1 maltose ABC transporter substrate-binding protein [Caldalkalibacillus thermarum]